MPNSLKRKSCEQRSSFIEPQDQFLFSLTEKGILGFHIADRARALLFNEDFWKRQIFFDVLYLFYLFSYFWPSFIDGSNEKGMQIFILDYK